MKEITILNAAGGLLVGGFSNKFEECVQLAKQTMNNGKAFEKLKQFAKENNVLVKEKRITRDEVYIADEAFFTGTAAEVTPIRELDNRQIGDGSKGPITTKLQNKYFDCVKGKLTEGTEVRSNPNKASNSDPENRSTGNSIKSLAQIHQESGRVISASERRQRITKKKR